MTGRQLKRPEPVKNSGADTAALKPGTSTISTARPSETCSPPAICGSSPTSIVSVMTRTKAPSATAPTDSHSRLILGFAAAASAQTAAGRVGTAAAHDDAATTRALGALCGGVASLFSAICSLWQPTEGIWSLTKRSMANFAAADLNGLVRLVKHKLKKIQYRPHLINGCLAAIGLRIEPWPYSPQSTCTAGGVCPAGPTGGPGFRSR
jgi:hypothetical protein